jgi:hypothetical protein
MFTHAQLSAHDIRGPISQMLANLDGPEARKVWLPALKRMLRKENPWDGKPLFAPFKTVRTGQFTAATHMFALLKDQGFTVNKPAQLVFTQPEVIFSSEVREYDLVTFQPEELGLEDPHYTELYQAVLMHGLQPTPPEVVAAARLAYPEQPWDGDLNVLMKPISDGGTEVVLDLRHLYDPYEDDKPIIGIGTFDAPGHTLGGNWICVSEVRTI